MDNFHVSIVHVSALITLQNNFWPLVMSSSKLQTGGICINNSNLRALEISDFDLFVSCSQTSSIEASNDAPFIVRLAQEASVCRSYRPWWVVLQCKVLAGDSNNSVGSTPVGIVASFIDFSSPWGLWWRESDIALSWYQRRRASWRCSSTLFQMDDVSAEVLFMAVHILFCKLPKFLSYLLYITHKFSCQLNNPFRYDYKPVTHV